MGIKISTAKFIGKELRRYVKSQSIKGYEFARLIKISQGSLSDIMNGKSFPSASTLAKICIFTNINIVKLLTSQLQ